jgi:hypothetical protein
METLPTELLYYIFTYLKCVDIVNLGNTTSQFRYICRYYIERELWYRYKIRHVIPQKDKIMFLLCRETLVCMGCGVKKARRNRVQYRDLIETCLCEACMYNNPVYGVVSKTSALKDYFLKKEDMESLDYVMKKCKYTYGYFYSILDVKKIADVKHNGFEKFLEQKKKEEKEKLEKKQREMKGRKIKIKALIDTIKLDSSSYTPRPLEAIIEKYIHTGKTLKYVKKAIDKHNYFYDLLVSNGYKEFSLSHHRIKSIYNDFIHFVDFEDPQTENLLLNTFSIVFQKISREQMLCDALLCHQLYLRPDSVLCKRYIEDGDIDIRFVVDTMVEMDWFFNNTNYANRIKHEFYCKTHYMSDIEIEKFKENIKRLVFLKYKNKVRFYPLTLNRFL